VPEIRTAREITMDRRTFLKGSAALGLAAPQVARPALAQGAKVLRFVPQANLANFDPIWGTQYVVRNAGTLVWDMLYGVDEQLKPQRQMVESEEVSDDKLTWTFRLRPGLTWHDGAPVLSRDVVASPAGWPGTRSAS
jgi:peptide/nickel transport system substrate-binding protein